MAVAFLTIVLGWGMGYALPSYIDNSALTISAAAGIFVGALLAGLVTAHVNTGNLIIDGLIAGATTVIVTAMFMGGAFSSLWAMVFVGAFMATLVSKKFLAKRGM